MTDSSCVPSHVGICVSDMERAVRFCDGLGFERAERYDLDGLLGLTHLSFHAERVDEVAARLVAHGGTILEETRSDIGVVLLFLADPDGTRIELTGR